MSSPLAAAEAIQQAGAAVHAAHLVLEAATQNQAARVSQALGTNPSGLENDGLFKAWKSLAGTAQEVQTLDQMLRVIHANLSKLANESAAAMTSGASFPASMAAQSEPKVRKTKAKPEPRKTAVKQQHVQKARIKKAAELPSSPDGEATGNDARVLSYLRTVLKSDDFTRINQAQVADAVGIPKGSIARSMSQLALKGILLMGGKKEFKLAT